MNFLHRHSISLIIQERTVQSDLSMKNIFDTNQMVKDHECIFLPSIMSYRIDSSLLFLLKDSINYFNNLTLFKGSYKKLLLMTENYGIFYKAFIRK